MLDRVNYTLFFKKKKKQDLVSTFQKTDIRLKIWTLDNIY